MRSRIQNSIRGSRNRAIGSAFESWVETQHQKAIYLGLLVHVVHNEAHTNTVGGKLMYTAPGVADYTGTLRNGFTLAVEAKSRSEDRLYKSDISSEQQKHLNAVAKTPALAILLVEFSVLRVRFAVPWLEVPWQVVRSAESVSSNLLDKWRVDSNPESCYLTKLVR